VGGLIISQVLTLYTTPVIYLMLDRLHRMLGGGRIATAGEAHSAPRLPNEAG
jgi:multidrug efflux pump